ncbi:MAG: class I SAM-dependent rRNA methyltransferase [Gemmataceae bacterium]
MNLPHVILQPKRAQPFFARHPWVFPGAVQAVEGDPVDGAEVDLVSSAGNFVARGFFNSKSKIRVRLYSWDTGRPLDESFFRDRIEAAQRLRHTLFGIDAQQPAYRLIASEADGISGLTVDRYDRWLVMQPTSLAIGIRREMLADILMTTTGVDGIYLRTERGVGKLEGLELQDGPLRGALPDGPLLIREDRVQYQVDLRQGQKTGFFLDQRSNRAVAARYLPGRDVLDCFSYSGGFALHAAMAGAKSIECVDVSEPALALAKQNAELNALTNIEFVKADVFDHMAQLVTAKRQFGAVVLDPPKFARTRGAIPDALRGYRTLLGYALRLLGPDGILVMCCCSGLITAAEIEQVMAQVAIDVRRDLQILERRGQDADHPISVTCPESSYLKCFICRVL